MMQPMLDPAWPEQGGFLLGAQFAREVNSTLTAKKVGDVALMNAIDTKFVSIVDGLCNDHLPELQFSEDAISQYRSAALKAFRYFFVVRLSADKDASAALTLH
jgi:hypothetical protein